MVRNLQRLGYLLIGLNIALGFSQCELASRLEVNESQISRDERNEYHGITLDRAQKILDVMEVTLTTSVAEAPDAAA